MSGSLRDATQRTAAALGLVVLACACREPAPPTGPLFAVVRFAEAPDLRQQDQRLEWGEHMVIGEEARPVLSASRSFAVQWLRPEGEWGTTARVDLHALPTVVREARWAAVGGTVVLPSGFVVSPASPLPTSMVRLAEWDGRFLLGPAAGISGSPDDTSITVTLRPIPDLTQRDVVTAEVLVPPGAMLSFAISVEPAAWTPVAAAAEFTVTAIEAGQETPIFRSELDPGRRAAHRRWFEKRVPLAGFAGRRVRFRFASRRTGTRGETTLPLWGDPAVLAPRPGNAPPVVLISLDTLRAASVTSYGARRLTTPNLDRRMARAGAVFVNATAPYPNTLPSHMSMMTGLYPRTHGVQHIFATLAPEHPTLPERLRAAGYETAAFTEDGFIVPEAGFRRGVALYTENKGRGIQDVPGYAARTFARGMAWLERHADQPFFLFLHTYQVHFPYTPPPLYRSYFGERRTPAALGEYDRLAYEREVRYVDDEVGAFLERLDALGLAARTLVIVTADHGEEFFEHGQRLHNFQLYEESVRVPLFMRFSTRIPPGLRPEAPVSLVDIAPTILDLVGLPAVPRADGTSLVPLLERGPEAFSRRAVFAETISSLQSPMVDLIAVRTLQHKCIRHAATGVHECYDLLADPRERRPLAADEDTPEIAQARGLLEAFRTTARSEPVTTPGQIDPERERNLRALGYVD